MPALRNRPLRGVAFAPLVLYGNQRLFLWTGPEKMVTVPGVFGRSLRGTYNLL